MKIIAPATRSQDAKKDIDLDSKEKAEKDLSPRKISWVRKQRLSRNTNCGSGDRGVWGGSHRLKGKVAMVKRYSRKNANRKTL